MAECFLNFHICGNLIHGHVAGAFNHDLYILRPCALCQLAKGNQLLNLRRIGCIRKAAGAAGLVDEYRIMCESALSVFRAGANMLITYYAKELAQAIQKGDIG